MVILSPQRYSCVPWLWHADLEEGRRYLWRRDFDHVGERHSAWAITVYDHREQTEMGLVVHAVRGNGNDGGVITLAIRELPAVEAAARVEPLDMRLLAECQSAPVRRRADDAGGHDDDEG